MTVFPGRLVIPALLATGYSTAAAADTQEFSYESGGYAQDVFAQASAERRNKQSDGGIKVSLNS